MNMVQTALSCRSDSGLKEHNLLHLTKARRYGITLEQLVVLSHFESVNALLIAQGLNQQERLLKLNSVAIVQMQSLL